MNTNNMENSFDGSATAGSPITDVVPDPNALGAEVKAPETKATDTGEATKTNEKNEEKIDPVQHKELEKLVGTQGDELGQLRKFFTDISPILDKLDKSPETVQAILDGDITPELAKAAMEGKVTIGDAEIVTKAQEEVKKDLGKEDYQKASAEAVTKLIEDKAKEIKDDFDKKLKERDELSSFETEVNDFIAKTSDFSKYSTAIDKWLDEHDVTDIAVAYYAVKGELSEKEAEEQAKLDKVEEEKKIAANAGGGQAIATHIKADDNEGIDSLIAHKSNPNIFE